jgi:hypothetical protein
MAANTNGEGTKSSGVALLVAWLFVGIPLGWGVYNTALSSMKLFQAGPAPAMPAPAPSSPR